MLDPPFFILKIQIQIWLQRLQTQSITNFIQIWTFLIFQVHHVGSAIFNFKNPNLDLGSATPKTFLAQYFFFA